MELAVLVVVILVLFILFMFICFCCYSSYKRRMAQLDKLGMSDRNSDALGGDSVIDDSNTVTMEPPPEMHPYTQSAPSLDQESFDIPGAVAGPPHHNQPHINSAIHRETRDMNMDEAAKRFMGQPQESPSLNNTQNASPNDDETASDVSRAALEIIAQSIQASQDKLAIVDLTPLIYSEVAPPSNNIKDNSDVTLIPIHQDEALTIPSPDDYQMANGESADNLKYQQLIDEEIVIGKSPGAGGGKNPPSKQRKSVSKKPTKAENKKQLKSPGGALKPRSPKKPQAPPPQNILPSSPPSSVHVPPPPPPVPPSESITSPPPPPQSRSEEVATLHKAETKTSSSVSNFHVILSKLSTDDVKKLETLSSSSSTFILDPTVSLPESIETNALSLMSKTSSYGDKDEVLVTLWDRDDNQSESSRK